MQPQNTVFYVNIKVPQGKNTTALELEYTYFFASPCFHFLCGGLQFFETLWIFHVFFFF